MEALDDAPLEFHDDVEVALPEVVCTWRTPDDPADADVDALPSLPAVPLLPLLPAVGAALALEQQQDAADGRGSPARRRTCAAVASSWFARRASAPEPRPQSPDDDQPPPILAALAAVAPAPDRPHGGGGARCLDPFHYSVSPASPPRPCGRVHSAITLPSGLSEELRTPTLEVAPTLGARPPAREPTAAPSPPRHRRATATSSPHDAAAASAPSAPPGARSGSSGASGGSCWDHQETKERNVGDTKANDAITNTTTNDAITNDVNTNATAQSILAVRGAGRSTEFARSLQLGADLVSIPVDPDPTVVGRGSPPRLLPPIAVRSCDQPRSPRKPSATQ